MLYWERISNGQSIVYSDYTVNNKSSSKVWALTIHATTNPKWHSVSNVHMHTHTVQHARYTHTQYSMYSTHMQYSMHSTHTGHTHPHSTHAQYNTHSIGEWFSDFLASGLKLLTFGELEITFGWRATFWLAGHVWENWWSFFAYFNFWMPLPGQFRALQAIFGPWATSWEPLV
jgi:hypothetical protein